MKNIIFIISLFLIIITIIPILFKIKISFSIIDKIGTFSIFIFNIKIINFLFYVKDKKILIKTKRHKKEVEMEVSNEQIRLVEQLISQIKNKVIINSIIIDSKIGMGNAFDSAIISTSVLSLILSGLAIIKEKKKIEDFKINNYTSFNEKVFHISLNLKFSISLFDILYCLFMSIIITKRSDKYERI